MSGQDSQHTSWNWMNWTIYNLPIHLPHVCMKIAVVNQMDPFDEVAHYSLLPIYTIHTASEWQRVF